jgi:hypothetical protein
MLGQFLELRDIVCCPGNIVSRGEHHRYSPYREISLRPIRQVSADPWPHHVGNRFEVPRRADAYCDAMRPISS